MMPVNESDPQSNPICHMNVECSKCHALHWMCEKLSNSSQHHNSEFGTCCINGKMYFLISSHCPESCMSCILVVTILLISWKKFASITMHLLWHLLELKLMTVSIVNIGIVCLRSNELYITSMDNFFLMTMR
jgi:hypothetical protein